MIDFEPDEEQALIVETVRQFAENEIRPKARECEEAGALDASVLEQAHELGLVTNALPEAHGGGGERSAITGVPDRRGAGLGRSRLRARGPLPERWALPVADFGTEAQCRPSCYRLTPGRSFAPGSTRARRAALRLRPFRPQTTAKRDGDEIRPRRRAKCFVPWQTGRFRRCS